MRGSAGAISVIKAWSLVSLLEAARTLARLAFERSGQLLYQVGSRYILRFEPRSGASIRRPPCLLVPYSPLASLRLKWRSLGFQQL